MKIKNTLGKEQTVSNRYGTLTFRKKYHHANSHDLHCSHEDCIEIIPIEFQGECLETALYNLCDFFCIRLNNRIRYTYK